MSPADPPHLAVQLVQSEESGKFRVLASIIKDSFLEVQVIMTAEQAEDFSQKLAAIAREARGRSIIIPPPGRIGLA